MRVEAFDFDLPAEQIALHPVEPRDSARLLVVDPEGLFHDRVVTHLPEILQAGDVLVINDTKVLPTELRGVRYRDGNQANIALNLHKRVDSSRWKAFARPGKRLTAGDKLELGSGPDKLQATVAEKGDNGEFTLAFAVSGAELDEAIKAQGAMPLPPYIGAKRRVEERDKSDYQTVYAQHEGAVAAPTAGLHFTPELLDALQERGVLVERVTLHVGAGTFLPVKVDSIEEHRMHAEWGVIDPDTVARIKAAKARGGRVVAVGTTSLRLLESAAREAGELAPFDGDTDIFITPGYKFRVVDILMTNFHLPRSTLFMLVSAFSGLGRMHRAYAHAIDNNYRFYSYGDSSLLFRAEAGK